uniref:Uncharacterized protein n=1 Tax=Parascaris equorum TaxID=6256 RepID=A0A914RHB4_PAREQ
FQTEEIRIDAIGTRITNSRSLSLITGYYEGNIVRLLVNENFGCQRSIAHARQRHHLVAHMCCTFLPVILVWFSVGYEVIAFYIMTNIS